MFGTCGGSLFCTDVTPSVVTLLIKCTVAQAAALRTALAGRSRAHFTHKGGFQCCYVTDQGIVCGRIDRHAAVKDHMLVRADLDGMPVIKAQRNPAFACNNRVILVDDITRDGNLFTAVRSNHLHYAFYCRYHSDCSCHLISFECFLAVL